MNTIPTNAHFCQRARERAGVEDPEALFLALCRAIEEQRHDVIEHCFDVPGPEAPDGRPIRAIWRFRVASGEVFYAVVSRLMMRPITILTHEQVRFYREKKRLQKPKGHKGRRVCKS